MKNKLKAIKKVLIINQFASTPKNSTGAGERFYFLAEEFQKKNIETVVISAGFNHLFHKLPKLKGLFTWDYFKHVSYCWVNIKKYSPNSNLGRILAFFDFAIKLFFFPIKKHGLPDVVVVSSMSIFPVFYASYLKRKYKIPFVLEIRDIWPLTPIQLGGHNPKHPFIKLLSFAENFAYKRADHIVSVLPGFGLYLKEKGFNKKNFTWIPNGILEYDIDQKNKNIKELFPYDKDSFVIIYTGTIGKANAMECVIEAAKILYESSYKIEFLLIGEGYELDNLKEKAKGFNNITFLPKVSKEEVVLWLKEADVAIISWLDKELYKYGVSANKYNDYMLAEKPIISASNINDDPVNFAECGLQITPENPDSLAKAIIQMYLMPKENRIALGEKGRNYLKNNNTYIKLSERYKDVFNNL